ncbi:metal-dependent hydrolase [Halobellus sp. Atlit-38R]|uniref:metal-dependent hydrolase n=1 Tax=Halobellus sp. Atlit-38R TaxID=2282131 RepID=UPI000EF24024|nr:metal-dependent hydrolase [Halobellus sp. Atlit-38R]RLM83593.1 metal-dependent hydrolase [Halobellus sp. Atlit-38R]
MLPWGHAALGYVLYSLYARRRYGGPPVGLTVFALGIGTQIPDLIDKPFTWTIPLLPYGRSLGHSLFVLGAICSLLWLYFQHPDQRALTSAFGIGYSSHLVGDAIGPVVYGEYANLGYLLWPITNVPAEGSTRSFLAFFLNLTLTPLLWFGVGLTVVAFGLWIADGMPGVRDLIWGPKTTSRTQSVQDK